MKDKSNHAHILLVEDNEGDIFLTREAFKMSKIETDIGVVKNGQEALNFLFKKEDHINAKTPDLVLMDINMPFFNGHEVLKQIKDDSELKKIPVIMLTTSTNQKDIDNAYNNHCNSYIQKPSNMTEFINTVQTIEQFWFQLTTLPNVKSF